MDDHKIAVKVGDSVVIYNVLFTLDDEVTKKHYIFYAGNTVDKDGDVVINVGIQDPKTNEILPITDAKEKEMLEKVLKSVEDSVRESQSN